MSKFYKTNKQTNKQTNKAKTYVGAGLLLTGLALANPVQAALLYSVTDLGTLGGSASIGQGINNAGQVTGYSATASGQYS